LGLLGAGLAVAACGGRAARRAPARGAGARVRSGSGGARVFGGSGGA